MTKGMTNKDRFRELAVEVLEKAEAPLGYAEIRERVLDLAKSRGKSTKALSNICRRSVHSVLLHDEKKRFTRINHEPSVWAVRKEAA